TRGPLILASNHISDSDPPVLGAAVRFPIAWMAKRELWQIRPLVPVLDFVGSFPVDPASPDRAALKMAAQVLQNGDALVVFPEGCISPDGELGAIMPGAMLIALKSGAPVVPVGMWGAQKIVPHGSLVPRPTLAPVRVHFGAPLRFDDLQDLPPREARVLATRRLENALREARSIAQGNR
ncbi:MAG: 1-acyl-sn-glycerol-3-phosphate acyltransferase, partial [Armatimonadetes bacterium]|nr:1-acyl-sn-glycerol-3-phosphate acyltransferase [Armatimonadota bacterium]